MILTVTLNPSVDISYPLKQLDIDSVNRVADVRKEAGGKGLNVTRVIKLANQDVLATGFLGGILGSYIAKRLDDVNIKHDFYPVAEESRNCIAILHGGLQTEILESGPVISLSEQENFVNHFSELQKLARIITISGSLPSGVPKDFYQKLIELANRENKKVLLDCSGQCLKKAIEGSVLPYLIKPNKEELEQLTGKSLDLNSIQSFVDIVKSHNALQEIPWIVVSLGKNGAFAKVKDKYFSVKVPRIKVINAVGSGDSTIAGLAIGINNNESFEDILKKAMAFGVLNALEEQTGCINMCLYKNIFDQITVNPY
ncbi:hexose kinase [Brenneria populi]|uniref:Phosphofructokinase n=1 Tax=Brenneria populi TaxID=1505588 RepID=A0ABU6JKZ5_9GAMM|nr:hexose kinase [Brenneria populi Li et al. 2015]